MTQKKSMIDSIRADFPCLNQLVNDRPLVFLDSAASAQKPQVVIDTLSSVYKQHYANVHRGIYALSDRATRMFELTRQKVADFIHASSSHEIVFTKGATESINLVAHSYGGQHVQAEDEIIISEMEHHANIVPWQQLCKRIGAKLLVAPVNDAGELEIEHFNALLSSRTKIVAITHMSNVLGTINPIKKIIEAVHAVGAVVLVDACQSIVHQEIDVQALEADFLVFSGHKLYGPNGTGVLYGKLELLDSMPPYQMGGEMVDVVSFEETTFMPPPLRFEAGTPVIAEIIALGSAIDYLSTLDFDAVRAHEKQLFEQLLSVVAERPNFCVLGNPGHRAGVVSFTHAHAHASDIGEILDQCGIAVRTGHHCAQPLLRRYGLTATARASIAMYNNEADIEAFSAGLKKVDQFFG